MALSFWARASSTAFFAVIAAATFGQATGRFGQEGLPQPSGMELTVEGFRIERAPGDTFKFLSPLAEMKRVETSERHCVVHFREIEGNPKKITVNTRSPGFEIEFKGAPTFKLGNLQRPLLTVDDASYDGTSSPAKKWMLVSFRDRQPPVLFAGLDADCEWDIIGQPGSWVLTAKSDQPTRIRVALPRGRDLGQYDTLEMLGPLALTLSIEEEYWCGQTPKLVETRISDIGDQLEVVQSFDRLGALLPGAYPLTRQGGYGIEVLTGITQVQADLTFGPQVFSLEPKIVTRFPFIGVPAGRALVQGEVPKEAAQTDRLWSLLLSSGDPVEGKKLALEGSGGTRAFAECAMNRWGWGEPAAPEWKRLLWLRDSETLQLTGIGSTDAAWLAAALALRLELALQVDACQVWAGVVALRSLPEFQRKRGLSDPVVGAEIPDREVWNALFGQWPVIPGEWWRALSSPVRVLSAQRLVCGKDQILDWKPVPGEGPLLIAAQANVIWTPEKGTTITEAAHLEGRWVIRAKPGPDGRCWIKGANLPPIPAAPKSGQR